MVSQCLKKHANEKQDRVFVNTSSPKPIAVSSTVCVSVQKEKLARNKAGLRALTKKSVSLKKKKAILQKGGFWDPY
jgi:hypothetical protein